MSKEEKKSLSFLTLELIRLLKLDPTNLLDINLMAKTLKVPKRRMYDITNVLEGIGVVQKFKKQKVKLIDPHADESLTTLDAQLLALEVETKALEKKKEEMNKKMEEKSTELRKFLEKNKPDSLYVSESDLVFLAERSGLKKDILICGRGKDGKAPKISLNSTKNKKEFEIVLSGLHPELTLLHKANKGGAE